MNERNSADQVSNQASSPQEWPVPTRGVAVTHLLIVRDVERSLRFYSDVLGGEVLMQGPPGILRFHNTWLILSEEGEATDDRPGVAARAPDPRAPLTSALNLRVPDVADVYERWGVKGAQFMTPPKEHKSEIRCYLRDPDGHLIEVGQSKGQPKAATDNSLYDVLVIGAGPTGLTLAICLLARGRHVAIVDKVEEGDNTSRAAVVYPATLEELEPYGVAERLVGKGIRASRFTIRDRDRVLMPVPFDKLRTAFPFTLLVSQAVTEATLLERFKQLGGRVLRPLTATRVEQDEATVTVTFADGQRIKAKFVVGADGVHSTVRGQIGIESERDNTGASYSLADVHLTGGVPDDELVVYFSPAGHMVVLPLPGGIHRIVAHIEEAPEHPDVPFLQKLMDTRGPEAEHSTIHDVVWGSRFLTHHSLANHFRAGRVVLAGDAAHEHSPLGGQGMNLGINDAVALGRALSAVFEGAPLSLLDAYSNAQRPIAKQVIEITNLLTRTATLPERLVLLRNMVVGALNPFIRRRLARRLSLLNYLDQGRRDVVFSGRNDPRSEQPSKVA